MPLQNRYEYGKEEQTTPKSVAAEIPATANCPSCDRAVQLARQINLKSEEINPNSGGIVPPLIAKMAAAGEHYDGHSQQMRLILYWACNDCLRTGQAVMADPSKQQWCDLMPYYAYYDEKRKCLDCGEIFVFTKEEQKHWYETLRFWVQSRPKYCKACTQRRKHRE